MNFEHDLERLREQKETLQSEIEELEAELDKKTANTKNLRANLEELTESIETGEVPEEETEDDELVAGIEPVELNEGSEKPPRGSRTRQIEQAIEVVSQEKDKFKAADIFNLLQEADDSVQESQRAYLYSKLDDFKDEGRLEKVKRGTWTLADW